MMEMQDHWLRMTLAVSRISFCCWGFAEAKSCSRSCSCWPEKGGRESESRFVHLCGLGDLFYGHILFESKSLCQCLFGYLVISLVRLCFFW